MTKDMSRDGLIDQAIAAHEAIFRALRGEWAREWLTTDLTLPQMKVLFFLEGAGELSMSQLAEALGKAQPTVTGLIDRLVEHGLITRAESAADRRVTLVRLADAGHDLVASLAQARAAHTRRLLRQLTNEELALVLSAFTVLSREAQVLAGEAHPAAPLGR